nr:hypothetical protein [Tanacetum cinerariifolium]
MGKNSLFSSSFNIFDSLSKIHEDHHWEIQRQSWNEDSRLDDLRRDEANRVLSDVCEALIPTVDKVDELILQDTLQVSLAKHKSRQEQKTRENVVLVEEHLASVEIEKMVEGQENVVDDSSIPRNAEHNILSTRLEPRSDNESLEVEFTDVVIPVNVYDEEEEEDEITDEVYELKQKEKGKNVEESRITPFPTPIRSPRIHTNLVSLDTGKLKELTVTTSSSSSPNTKLSNTNQLLSLFKAKPAHFKLYKSFFQALQGRYRYLFEHLRAKFMPRKSFVTLADHLHEAMANSLPTMVYKHIKEQVQQQVPEQTDSYASDDDEIPIKQVSQDIMEEVSLNIDEAKLKKIADKMPRQRYTSGDKHQYHIDQMKNFLKNDIRDPEARVLSLINQDLLYLKKGNSGPQKIVLSLPKFPAINFNDDDIKERTSIWVNKCVKKFNPYA